MPPKPPSRSSQAGLTAGGLGKILALQDFRGKRTDTTGNCSAEYRHSPMPVLLHSQARRFWYYRNFKNASRRAKGQPENILKSPDNPVIPEFPRFHAQCDAVAQESQYNFAKKDVPKHTL